MSQYAVVVIKIDRYARSIIDLLNSIPEFEQNGVDFISVQDSGIDTISPNGQLLLQILGAFAEFERTTINSRTSAGRAKAKGVKFVRPSLKTSKSKGGKYIDPKRVLELKSKGMSEIPICRLMECSITPVMKILKNAWMIKREERNSSRKGKTIKDSALNLIIITIFN